MAGDAGDEFAAESQQNASQMISYLMYRAGVKGASCGASGKAEGKGGISQMMRPAFNAFLPKPSSEAETGPTEAAVQEGPPDARGPGDCPEAMEVLVDNEADFEFIKSVLDQNGAEYTVARETAPDASFSLSARTYSEGAGVAVFRLPDRDIGPKADIHAPFSQTDHVIAPSGHPFTQLKDLDKEVLGLLGFYSRPNMVEKWALRGAIDGLGKDSLLQGAPGLGGMQPFRAGARQNFAAEFTTAKWDPDARIIADPLERMGVPFGLTTENGTARFEVAPQGAQAFKAVADFHLGNEASKISPDRFPNYGALEKAALAAGTGQELIEVTVADQGAATLLTDEFAERGIAYESLLSRATGESTFLVSKAELASKAPELAAAQKEFAAAGRTPGKTAARRVRQQEAERALGSAAKRPAPAPKGEGRVSAARKPTPARDRKTATKSARARSVSQNRKPARSAVHTPKPGGRP